MTSALSRFEDIATADVKALADAMRDVVEVMPAMSLGEYSQCVVDIAHDGYGLTVTAGENRLDEFIAHSLAVNGYDDHSDVATADRWELLDIADYALQIADAEGVIVTLKEGGQ